MRPLSFRRWLAVAALAHVALLGLAAWSYLAGFEPNNGSRSVFAMLAVWLVYLLVTRRQRPEAPNEGRALRYYFCGFTIAFFLLANAMLAYGPEVPEVPFKFWLLSALIPFAVVFRSRTS